MSAVAENWGHSTERPIIVPYLHTRTQTQCLSLNDCRSRREQQKQLFEESKAIPSLRRFNLMIAGTFDCSELTKAQMGDNVERSLSCFIMVPYA